jgi:hypothetical protein
VTFLTLVAVLTLSQGVLELNVEAPPELAVPAARIESLDPDRFVDIVRLVGLSHPGPVRIVLATEMSEWAQSMPPWIAGLAVHGDFIVLFPARSPAYPHGSLEDVLRHELAHVLIARAAGGHRVPRWFHEGLATAAERPWRLGDRTRLIYELTLGSRPTLRQVDRLFEGDRAEQSRAYALAGKFVRDLLANHGESVASDVLAGVSRGVPFDQAFTLATGRTLHLAEADFWRRQRTWTTWFPVVTSTTMLWMLIMLLAVYAARRRAERRIALHRRWTEEEAARDDTERLD